MSSMRISSKNIIPLLDEQKQTHYSVNVSILNKGFSMVFGCSEKGWEVSNGLFFASMSSDQIYFASSENFKVHLTPKMFFR